MKRTKREEGQSVVEYMLVLGLIAMVAFAAIKALGKDTKAAYKNAAELMREAGDPH